MKTATTFNKFDIVKFNANAEIIKTNPNAVDFYGIVREVGAKNSFVEWYNKKSKTSTAEALSTYTWFANTDLEYVGSLYQMLVSSLTPAQNMTASVATAAAIATAKPKRKYTRKPNAAKPGPKPKANKAVKATKKETVKEVKPTTPSVIYVERPTDVHGKPLTTEYQYSWNKKHVLATGKFENFFKREDIVKSIRDNNCLYDTHVGWNLDFVIVGKNPGPAKIQKLKYYNVPTMTEEQWLALIGDPIYKFREDAQAQTA